MDLSKPIPPQHPSPNLLPANSHYHSTIIHQTPIHNNNALPENIATSERIPTSTWGSFTIVVVVFLVLCTCFILNCGRIRRTVDGRRMDKLGRSGTFKKKSFERRHKDLQEADLEWNNHPPMVYEEKLPTTPESIHCSKHSSLSSSGWSSHSTLAAAHHYNNMNFIRNQPPSIQLRLTLENASSPSVITEPNMAFVPSSASSKSSNSSVHRPYQANLAPMPPFKNVTSSITNTSHITLSSL